MPTPCILLLTLDISIIITFIITTIVATIITIIVNIIIIATQLILAPTAMSITNVIKAQMVIIPIKILLLLASIKMIRMQGRCGYRTKPC